MVCGTSLTTLMFLALKNLKLLRHQPTYFFINVEAFQRLRAQVKPRVVVALVPNIGLFAYPEENAALSCLPAIQGSVCFLNSTTIDYGF